MNYIGNACYCSAADRLFGLGEERWLAQMKSRFKQVSPYPLTDEQVRAWANSYKVLASTFASLPPEYGKLQLIFEYVLPSHEPEEGAATEDIGVRADVILLSKDTVCVLEFKDRTGPYPGCERQARKYAKRLRRWHTGSVGMRKKTILVFTNASDISEKRYRLTVSSPDHLTGVLADLFPMPVRKLAEKNTKAWMNAPWGTGKKRKMPLQKEDITA